MTTYVGAGEAARLLGVSKPTLYAYVSRGLLGRRTAVDGRTSLYDRAEIERMAGRSARRRSPTERPSIDVRIDSAVTQLDDEVLTYRGHDAVELAAHAGYEQVAELLWTGDLPGAPVRWRVDRDSLARCRAAVAAAGLTDPMLALATSAVVLADDLTDESAHDAGRRLLAVVPSVLGGPQRGSIAERLAAAAVRRPTPELCAAIDRALVLLADHELATSTLAVRVAASVRSDAMSAVAAGLITVRGPLHGAAAAVATTLIDDARRVGAVAAVEARLADGGRLPGFGHRVYRSGDPRFAPLLDVVRGLPDPGHVLPVVDAILVEAGRRIGQLPNIDLALGALHAVGGLPARTPLFAVARIAGWIAHYVEELDARPVRYRGLARAVER